MEGFRVRKAVAGNQKAQAVYRDINDWCSDLLKIATLESNIKVGKYLKKSKENDADMDYVETIEIAHGIRDRCVHSIIHPELYDFSSEELQRYVYWFWTVAAQLTNKEEGRFIDHEFYVPRMGVFSRFFTQASRFENEHQNRSYEFYRYISNFANVFPWAYPEDQRCFEMYVDGVDKQVIAYLLKRPLEWVKDKLKYYIEIALENMPKFYEQSLADANLLLKDIEGE
jgi:hypothetical protein